ncbi:DeoR/GlpR family DNA-binding transcription regulator [Okibacterium endophyticum]
MGATDDHSTDDHTTEGHGDGERLGLTWLRRERIGAELERTGFVNSRDLATRFGVSTVTIRGDLRDLERLHMVKRVRGGAIAATLEGEKPFEITATEHEEEKAAIAKRSVAMIEPGMSIVLDVGTTTSAIATAIAADVERRGLTVFTNGINIVHILRGIPRLDVIVTGGSVRPMQHSLVNPLATLLFEHIHADLAFIGCTGVDARHGITNINLPEAEVKSAMVASSRRTVVVADSSKLGKVSLATVCPLSAIESVVTGKAASDAALSELRDLGTQVLVA